MKCSQDIPVTLYTALLALIIVHLQMHPSLHLQINIINQCIFKKIQIIDEFQKFYFFLFLNILQNQTYKYQNVPTWVKFCIQFNIIKWHLKGVISSYIPLIIKIHPVQLSSPSKQTPCRNEKPLHNFINLYLHDI